MEVDLEAVPRGECGRVVSILLLVRFDLEASGQIEQDALAAGRTENHRLVLRRPDDMWLGGEAAEVIEDVEDDAAAFAQPAHGWPVAAEAGRLMRLGDS